MDPISVISGLLQLLAQIPTVGKVIVMALGVVISLSAVVTAAVAIWHGVVTLVAALAAVPGLSGLKGISDSLKAADSVIQEESNLILKWIEQLSAIPLPQIPK